MGIRASIQYVAEFAYLTLASLFDCIEQPTSIGQRGPTFLSVNSLVLRGSVPFIPLSRVPELQRCAGYHRRVVV